MAIHNAAPLLGVLALQAQSGLFIQLLLLLSTMFSGCADVRAKFLFWHQHIC